MTWTDEVHERRTQSVMGLARAERRVRKRGLPVPVLETAQPGALLAMVAAVSGLYAWQLFGGAVRRSFAHNPLVQQFKALVLGTPTQRLGAKRGAAHGTSTGAKGPSSAGSGGGMPKAKAAAAAMARAAAATQQQPQQAGSSRRAAAVLAPHPAMAAPAVAAPVAPQQVRNGLCDPYIHAEGVVGTYRYQHGLERGGGGEPVVV